MYVTAGEESVDAVTVTGEATVAFGVGVQTVTAVVLVGVQVAVVAAGGVGVTGVTGVEVVGVVGVVSLPPGVVVDEPGVC